MSSSSSNSYSSAFATCKCGIAAPIRVSKTLENPNHKFMTCEIKRCNYFVWVDSLVPKVHVEVEKKIDYLMNRIEELENKNQNLELKNVKLEKVKLCLEKKMLDIEKNKRGKLYIVAVFVVLLIVLFVKNQEL
ncbi:hypothetical protein FRX31_013171 [Thalictrum thalictroides]|uniref:GRF-type domain-containing protein n=1 Tax=Thalictrum thalictroides TaxID=46969 RepID=A0A7J6WIQ6_THATH|nr:hypothetical protein FRX31_013171 [Thalictrum thalictroides]